MGHRAILHRCRRVPLRTLAPFRALNLTFICLSIFLSISPAVAAAPPSSDQEEAANPPSATRSDKDNPHLWKPQTQNVTVFKNGLGFFTREAEVELRDGWCHARDVPPAAFGTLAVYAKSEQQTVDVVGVGPGEIMAFDGHDAPQDADEKRRRLQAHQGLEVELTSDRDGEQHTTAGQLVSIGPEYAILQTTSAMSAVRIEKIAKMQILDMPLRVHVRQQDGTPANDAALGLAYLREGIMWIPEYTLNVLDEETAELTLRGTLVNEAEDLVHCDVNFVVGVPHFVHSELLSPVAVGRVIRTVGSATATNGVPSQVMTQIMNRAVIAQNSMRSAQDDSDGPVTRPAPAETGDLSAVINSLPQLENAAAGDFTVYTKENLTVRRGERAMVTLFTQKIRYRHLYGWEVPGSIQHFLVLDNATPTAWTTGPCLTLSDGNPLSEDLLTYTPRGGKGELQVTTAINIAHSQSEEEVGREMKAYNPGSDDFYDLVTLAGEIRLESFEPEPVELAIDLPINGRPLEADHDGSIRIDATKLRLLERSGTIRWRLVLHPGEKKVLSYRYERYVPSR